MKGVVRALGLGVFLFFLLALPVVPNWAGTPNALVTGSVFHQQSGAPVAGATVRLINALWGYSQTLTTEADGSYTFNSVPPGEDYQILVEKSGFITSDPRGLTIHVGDVKLVLPPIELQPEAQPGQQIQEQALKGTLKQAPRAPSVSLDLISTTVGGVVDTRAVHTLPLVGRDFIDLALLVPGTYPVEQGSVLEGASLVVNGARANMNNFLLDGTDNNDYTINESLPFQIVEAMQEFRVQAATSPAEYGRSGGAQINTISRWGSNTLHGTLFEFHRNSALSAKNFFSAYNGGTFQQYARILELGGEGNPLSDSTLADLYARRKPLVVQNQFGGNLGGPLRKDKLFGFFNWESFRVANPRPLFEHVPGLALRSASKCPDFVMPILDKVVSHACDPIVLRLYNLYPLPNVPTTRFTDPDLSAFFVGESENRTDSDNFLERIDWRFAAQASMSFKHNIQQIRQIQGGTIPQTPTYPGNGTRVRGRNQNFSYNYVHQLTPRTSNEFRFGWNQFRLNATALDASIDPAALGFKNVNFHDKGLPTVTVGGSSLVPFGGLRTLAPFSALGADLGTPSKRANNVWSLADSLSLTRGRHTWKFGGEFRHARLNVLNEALGRGLVTFFSGPAANNVPEDEPGVASKGLPDVASIARVDPAFSGGFDRSFYNQAINWYVQDQWRPWQNFTLNYGIRYEVNTPPVERLDRLVNFYPALGGLVRAHSTTILDPFREDLSGTHKTAPSRVPRAGFDTDKKGWGPRLGFAWNPWNKGKTVVRGSYAIAFDQQPFEPSVNMLLNPPFVQQDFPLFIFGFGPFFLEDTFSACGSAELADFADPSQLRCLSISSDPESTSLWISRPYSITARDPNTRTPYVHQFHVGVEQQLGSRGALELAYVGSAGHKLPRLRDISHCTADVFLADVDNPSHLSCFQGSTPAGQPDPFLTTSILNQETTANSAFHSLQVRFDTRNFHGLQLRSVYQWAKSIDNASSLQPQLLLFSPFIANVFISLNINPENLAGINNISRALSLRPGLPILTTRPRLPQDSTNLAGERGWSDFDIRHRFVINYIYDVPRWARGIGTGWQLAGITTVQSGQPFTVFFDYFGIPLRPNVIGPVLINTSSPQGAIDGGTLPGSPGSHFDLTPNFRAHPGSLGRNTFTGPKLVNFDFAVLKNFRLGKAERMNLQFRVELFNLFNNVNFRQPISRGGVVFSDAFGQLPCRNGGCLVRDPFFGRILQARSPREIQIAIKFTF